MTYDTKPLRDLLAKATPGRWIAAPYSSVVGASIVASPSGRSIGTITYFSLGDGFEKHDKESAANGALAATLHNEAPVMLDLIEQQAARIAALETALSEIANQKLWAEMSPDEREQGCFIDGYDWCVAIARQALADKEAAR